MNELVQVFGFAALITGFGAIVTLLLLILRTNVRPRAAEHGAPRFELIFWLQPFSLFDWLSHISDEARGDARMAAEYALARTCQGLLAGFYGSVFASMFAMIALVGRR